MPGKLHRSVYKHKPKKLRKLLEGGYNINEVFKGEPILVYAVQQNVYYKQHDKSPECVRIIFQFHPNLSKQVVDSLGLKKNPFHCVLTSEMLDILLSNIDGETTLVWLNEGGTQYSEPVLQSIIRGGAVAEEKARIVKALVKVSGIDLNIPDIRRGRVPLHEALYAKSPQLVKILCDAGADPNIKDTDGESPIQAAKRVIGMRKDRYDPDVAWYMYSLEIMKAAAKQNKTPM